MDIKALQVQKVDSFPLDFSVATNSKTEIKCLDGIGLFLPSDLRLWFYRTKPLGYILISIHGDLKAICLKPTKPLLCCHYKEFAQFGLNAPNYNNRNLISGN